MKKFLIFLLFLFCANNLFGYRFHLINNSMYNWHIVFKVAGGKLVQHSGFEAHADVGRYTGENLDTSGLKTLTAEIWVGPYSIVHINNYENPHYNNTSGYVWEKIEAKNMWGTKKNLKEGKSGADSIYWIIADDMKKGGGNILSYGWAKGGGKSHKWENYKKKHQDEMRRKYEEFENNMLFIHSGYPKLRDLTNTQQVAQQVKELRIQRAKEACEKLLKEKPTKDRIIELQTYIKKTQTRIADWEEKKDKFGQTSGSSDEKAYNEQKNNLKSAQAKLERALWQAEVDYERQGCKDLIKKDFMSEVERKMIRCYHIQSVKAGYVNLDALKKDIADTEKKITPTQERIDRLKNKTGWFASDMHKEAGRLETTIAPLRNRLAKLKEILETVSYGEQSYQKLDCPAIIGEQYNALEIDVCEKLLKEKPTKDRIAELQTYIKETRQRIAYWEKDIKERGDLVGDNKKRYEDQKNILKKYRVQLERALWQVEVYYEQQGCKDTLKKDFLSDAERKMIRCYHIAFIKSGDSDLGLLKKDIADTEKKMAEAQAKTESLRRRLAKLKEILETVSHGEQSYQKLGCPAIIGKPYDALEISASKN